jgi:hypothetical protein
MMFEGQQELPAHGRRRRCARPLYGTFQDASGGGSTNDDHHTRTLNNDLILQRLSHDFIKAGDYCLDVDDWVVSFLLKNCS